MAQNDDFLELLVGIGLIAAVGYGLYWVLKSANGLTEGQTMSGDEIRAKYSDASPGVAAQAAGRSNVDRQYESSSTQGVGRFQESDDEPERCKVCGTKYHVKHGYCSMCG